MTLDYYNEELSHYIDYLIQNEKSKHTIEKYKRDIKRFISFVEYKELNKNIIVEYKEQLKELYKPSSVNSILAAVNNYLSWIGKGDLKVKPLRIQRQIFSTIEKELSQKEYKQLIHTAEKQNNQKLALLIQTICSTGIRVSELQYITVQSTYTGRANVDCKGKKRIVFLSKELVRLLKAYCRKENIKEGHIFITKTGRPLDRSNIWKMMKKLCVEAKVKQEKVFPHNLRHLFARTYYKIEKDISRLADILGHVNINTTRIYTIESGSYHEMQINKMQLVLSSL